ncbi:MAG: GerMN domain-containing protein [Bacillota bacterium]
MLRQVLVAVLVLSMLAGLMVAGCQEAAPEVEEPEIENENGEENDNSENENGEENESTENEDDVGENGTENDEAAPESGDPIMLDIYFMEATETSFELGKETRELGTFGGPQIDLEEVMTELLKGPETDELSRVIPEETELRDVTLENGVAYVDFSEELLQAEVGSEAEAVLVDSIVKTLTQLEEVESVQILVEGEIVETIAGHIAVDEPLK